MHAPAAAAANPEMWNYGALLTTEGLIALVTLTAMEIVLGIDNIVFIAIVTGKVPEAQRARVRNIGLIMALVLRVGLLFGISWVMSLTATLFTVFKQDISGQSLILIIGGLFLLGKATYEIHHRVEGDDGHAQTGPEATIGGAAAIGAGRAAVGGAVGAAAVSVPFIIGQIIMLDLVFSLDSVITAVGMVKAIPLMIIAVLIAVAVMITFAGRISRFVERHPTIKMLALAFLVLIGVMLVAEGFHQKIPKGYIYFAMAFSLGVEMLNIRAGAKRRAKAAAAAGIH
jgi:predicted tellurium resistance membrane protein TerC